MSANPNKVYDAVIVGSGHSGLCMAVKLKEAGYENFVILEKADELGGTWRDNTYPGAACDVPSALYSYSFETNLAWKEAYTAQADLLEYQRFTADKYKLLPHIRYHQYVVRAQFDEERHVWSIQTEKGDSLKCHHFISAIGQLHRPNIPEFGGTFEGPSFHSSKWDHSTSLKGKRVAVIGNGASAVQIVPELAKEVDHLEIYQRTPSYIFPKLVGSYPQWLRKIVHIFPFINNVYRLLISAVAEFLLLPSIRGNWLIASMNKTVSLSIMKFHIKDTDMREKLTPKYPVGAKRVCYSNAYYPTLTKSNVQLNTNGIDHLVEDGIVDKTGNKVRLDAIVYATGFQTNPFCASMEMVGKDKKLLSDHWSKKGAHAYMGVCTHGFPNFSIIYGPNTNVGHTSVLLMIEAQTEFIIDQLSAMKKRGASSIEVKQKVEEEFVEEVDRRMETLAFSKIDGSWYIANGRVTTNWVGSTSEYETRLKKMDWDSYNFESV